MQRVINDRKVAIVGCGFVGSATAFALMQSELFTEMALIDVDRDRAEGEALDIAHGMPFADPMNIYAGDYDDAADAAIIIVTAGANQQPGETRLDLVHKNVRIFKSIIPELAQRDYQGILLVVSNPVDALMNANYIGILAWAVVLGIALRAASQSTKDVFASVSDAVSQVVRWVISLAPFGILGLVYTTVSANGLEIFTEYGQLLLVLVGCMLFIAFVTNPLLVLWGIRKNPYPLVLRCLKDSGITAFFTRSSAANIPVNMELCRKLGLDKDNYSVSIPLGATINMAGAAVTISVMAMAAAHTMR